MRNDPFTHGDSVTASDLEQAMDKIAHCIVAVADGAKYLAIYQRLERELTIIRAAETSMANVLARLERRGS